MRGSRVIGRSVLVLAAAAVIAGSVSTGASGAALGAGTSRPSADSPGVAAAKRQLLGASSIPATIQKVLLAAPLAKTPPKGKKVWFISNTTPDAARIRDAWVQAVKSLGWTPTTRTYNTADQAVGIVREALQQGANYIGYVAVPVQIMQPALDAARAANVPMFQSYDVTQPLGRVNWIFSNPGGAEQYINRGKLGADWVTVQTNGKAKTVLVNVPAYTVFAAWASAFKAEYAKNCPGCSIDEINVPVADALNGKMVATTVAYLRSHPDVNNVQFCHGTWSATFPVAAANAGLSNVVYGSGTASDLNLKLIANGQQGIAIGSGNEQEGYVLADAMARYSIGASLVPNWKSTAPLYIHQKSNTTATTTNFAGSPNYSGQFKKLWKLTP